MNIPEDFDEEYYLIMNPDVKLAISNGDFKSGKEHFLKFGHKENRSIHLPKISNILGNGIYPPHYFTYPYSNVENLPSVTFTTKSLSLPDDIILIKKIASSYLHATQTQPQDFRIDNSGMWSVNMKRYDQELSTPIKNHDLDKVAEHLSMMFNSDITYGLSTSKVGKYIAKLVPQSYASLWTDRLLRFCESIGVLHPRSIEQDIDYTAPLKLDPSKLISECLQKIIGVSSLSRPSVGETYGIQINEMVWDIRDFEHLLAAIQISRLLPDKTQPIFELGGGYGGLVYWLYILGFRNITLYDLPHVNILQGYYLSKSLPDAKIGLYDSKNNANNYEINIMPYWKLDDVNSNYFYLAVNQDSLPEIPKDIAIHYLKEIKRTTTDYFYSVNQESQAKNFQGDNQNIVPKLIQNLTGFKLLIRSPFWCRPGYVQEIYRNLSSLKI